MRPLQTEQINQVVGGHPLVAGGIIVTAKAVRAVYRTAKAVGETTGATDRKRENLGISDS